MKERASLPRRFNFNPNIVYSVTSESDPTVLVAIKPKFEEVDEKVYVVWFDTVKDRAMSILSILDESPESFTFLVEGNSKYTFTPLSKECFETDVLPHLITPPPENLNTVIDIYKFLSSSLFEE